MAAKTKFCSAACIATAKTVAKQLQRREWEANRALEIAPPVGARWLSVREDVFAIVDEDMFEIVSKMLWNLTTRGYVARHRPSGNVYQHHIVMSGPPPEGWVYDHVNRNQLDNRRENLRLARKYQNSANVAKRSTNTSGFMGVKWAKTNQAWSAALTVQGVRHHIGFFKDKIEAAHARDAIARELLGEFAQLNFP